MLGWLMLSAPREEDTKSVTSEVQQTSNDYQPSQVLKTPVFWVMYLMFVAVAGGGLMATAQLASIAKDWGVADIPVTLLGLTLPCLTFALAIDRVVNGVTRPCVGWVSDRIGREPTMCIAFLREAVGM